MRTERLAFRAHQSVVVLLLCGLALTFSRALSAEEEEPVLRGGTPPPMVRRAAYAEAVKYLASFQKESDSKYNALHQPTLLSAQRTADFMHPSEPAWLLLYCVGNAGPRAHTSISQLILVSAKDGRIIFKSPRSYSGEGCPQDMDDAFVVQIAPGRFALGLSCGVGFRWGGHATVLSLGGSQPYHQLFDLDSKEGEKRTSSTVYFVRVAAGEPLALAVRQSQESLDDQPKYERQEFLYRLNTELDHYERVPFPAEKLTELIEAARRDKSNLKMFQVPAVGFDDPQQDADDADDALNDVYNQLREKLSPDEKQRLRRQEIDWLARRDAIGDVPGRTTFVWERVKELRKRLGHQ